MTELALSIDSELKINEELKEKAFSVIKECGLTPSQVIEFFFQEIVALKTIPMVIRGAKEEVEEDVDLSVFCGAINFEGDPVERQRELRREEG